MSLLNMREKWASDQFCVLSSRYVVNYSDQTFGVFVNESLDIELHSGDYTTHKTSKVKKLRTFWGDNSDHIDRRLLNTLIEKNDQIYGKFRALTDNLEATAKIDYLYINFDMHKHLGFRRFIGTEQASNL